MPSKVMKSKYGNGELDNHIRKMQFYGPYKDNDGYYHIEQKNEGKQDGISVWFYPDYGITVSCKDGDTYLYYLLVNSNEARLEKLSSNIPFSVNYPVYSLDHQGNLKRK